MQQDILNIDAKMDLSGEIEFLLPNQQKGMASRVELTFLADSGQQNFELKLEIFPAQVQQLQVCFDIQPEAAVQRFRMKAHILARILPEWEANLAGEALLRAGSGAALCLENYDLVGASVWFDDAISIFPPNPESST